MVMETQPGIKINILSLQIISLQMFGCKPLLDLPWTHQVPTAYQIPIENSVRCLGQNFLFLVSRIPVALMNVKAIQTSIKM